MEKWLVSLSILIGAATIWVGVQQYKTTSARMAMSPFLDKQLEIYAIVTDIAGQLVSTSDPIIYRAKSDEFWKYYYGSLALVEDSTVESEMVKFGRLLQQSEFNGASGNDDLKQAALSLSQACRRSISDSWKINLAPLEERLVPNR